MALTKKTHMTAASDKYFDTLLLEAIDEALFPLNEATRDSLYFQTKFGINRFPERLDE